MIDHLLHSYKFKFLAITVLYYISGKLGLLLSFFEQSITLVWPPTGIALAALLLLGLKYWPAIVLSAFLVNISSDLSLLTVIGITIGNSSAAIVGAYLLIKVFNFQNTINRLHDVFLFIVIAALMTPLISATVGVFSLVASGVADLSIVGHLWTGWWVGDAIGILIVGSFLMVWSSFFPIQWDKKLWNNKNIIQAIALFSILIAVSNMVFNVEELPENIIGSLSYIIFPLVMIISIRFKQLGAVSAVLVVAIIAIWMVVENIDLMNKESLEASLLYLNGYLAVLATTAMTISASIYERQFATKVLQESVNKCQLLVDNENKLTKSNMELEAYIDQRNTELVDVNLHLDSEIKMHRRTYSSLMRFHSALDASLDAVYLIDPSEHRFLDSNKAGWKSLGYTKDELLSMGPSNIKPLISKQQLEEYFVQAHNEKDKEIIITTLHQRKDKSVFPVEVGVRSVRIDSGLFVIAIARDLTEKRKTELAIQESKATIRTLIDAPTDEYFILYDCDYKVLELNKSMANNLKRSVNELVGKNIKDIFSLEVSNQCIVWLDQVKESKIPMTFKDKRGDRLLEVRIYPVLDVEENLIRIAIFSVDITEMKKETDKRLAQEVEHRDTLVREVHHRIKNNLQSVTGLLRRQIRKHPENKDAMNDAISQVEVIAVVHGLQGIVEGSDRIELVTMIENIIKETTDLYVQCQSIEFKNKMKSGFIVNVDDAVALALIINELITNAIKHATHKDVSGIKIVLEENIDYVCIGISNPGKLPADFDFEEAHGVGTGLNLVRSLMQFDESEFSLNDENHEVTVKLKLSYNMLTLIQ